MENLTISHLNGNTHSNSEHHCVLPQFQPASEEQMRQMWNSLSRVPASCRNPASWEAEVQHLRAYGFSTFMDDAPEETWQYQLRSRYNRTELDQLWSSKDFAPPSLRSAYGDRLVQLYEQPQFGIRANLLSNLSVQEIRLQISGAAGLYWFAADLLRATRIAQPIYLDLGRTDSHAINRLLLRKISGELAQVTEGLKGTSQQLTASLVALIDVES